MAYSPARLISRRILSSIADAHRRRLSTATTESLISPSKIPQKTISSSSCPPWMMLPPTYTAAGSIDYNFYSLAEKRVSTLPQTPGLSGFMPNRIQDLKLCGSSKGWMALFNPDSLDLFLYNPISLRFIKLPNIRNLPNVSKLNERSVTKLILSGSPDEADCRAVMTYNSISALAFCLPGRSKKWTPIGKTLDTCYQDIAYSTRRNQLFALNRDCDLETWDLSDSLRPRMVKTREDKDEDYVFYDNPREGGLPPKSMCRMDDYLVVADELFSDDEDDVLVVGRYVMEKVAPDGSYIDEYTSLYRHPHVTIGFDIDVYDKEDDEEFHVDSLGDLSLFLGGCGSDAVALSATEFPELKPNSVYFTDSWETRVTDNYLFGGHDIGIFDYENNTVSPCYYPCDLKDLKRIAPSPMWFFPIL